MEEERLIVTFLGIEYSFPKDILTYNNEHHYFESLRKELMDFMLKFYGDFTSLPKDSSTLAYNRFVSIADKCVKRLLSRNLFNVTVENFIGSKPESLSPKDIEEKSINKGLTLFFKEIYNAVLEQGYALLERMETFLNSAQQAEINKQSKITGLDYGIITNSIIGYGVWAVMEDNAINKQTKRANAEFQAEINQIINNVQSRQNKRLDNYEKNVWLPNLIKSVNLFIAELFQQYLDILIRNNRLNKECLNFIDIQKSKSILENMKFTDQKIELINTAFVYCPFCLEVYTAALSNGGDLQELFFCAKAFNIETVLIETLLSNYRNIILDIRYSEKEITNKLKGYYSLVASYICKNDNEAANYFFSERRVIIKNQLRKSKSFCCDWRNTEVFKNTIKAITKANISEAIEMDRKQLENMVLEFILTKHIRIPKQDYLIYKLYLDNLVNGVLKSLDLYKQTLIVAKEKYEKSNIEYLRFKELTEDTIARLNNELQHLTVFSVSKKKTIRAKIEELNDSIIKEKIKVSDCKSAYLALT